MKGTPSHLGELICIIAAAKVGQTLPLGTVSSSKYPGFFSPSFVSAPTYCPNKVSSIVIGGIYLNTFTYKKRFSKTRS